MSLFNVGFVIFPEVLARLPNSAMHIIAKTKEPVPSDSSLSLLPTHTFQNCPNLDFICVPRGVPGRC